MFRILVFTIVWIANIVSSNAQDIKKPNFVWILSEDNSIHYLQYFFEGGAEAPNIEAMAQNGLTFTNAFSNSPVCSVARTTLATSSYAPRIGTQYHRKYIEADLPDDLHLFQTYLERAGYYTTNNFKTDYNVNVDESVWNKSSDTASWRDRKNTDQPFFHMETHAQSHEGRLHFDQDTFENVKTIHDPELVQLADYMPDTPLSRYTHALYLDKMVIIDGKVGNTLAKLKEDGLLEDTFVFYFGDHGGVLPRSKGYVYDAGLHIPLVVRVPENFKHLVDGNSGSKVDGFVNFIDFGPTVLALAGIDVPDSVDGKPFLGQSIDMDEVNKRDQSFGYADRFDEKYDLIRSLRKGDFHYMRNYQSYLPDGLQNNYRYRMLALKEIRDLNNSDKLNSEQSAFHRPKKVEALYNVRNDPFNVHNLSDDPEYADILIDMRNRLQNKIKSLPDLSFYSESYLAKHDVFKNARRFGQDHKDEIATLIETADYALLPFNVAKIKILAALQSENELVRMWAIAAATSFGEDALEIAYVIEPLLHDASLRVQLRAADFVGVLGIMNPQPFLAKIINETNEPILATETLNSVVLFNDYYGAMYPVKVETLKPKVEGLDIERRMVYLKEPNILH